MENRFECFYDVDGCDSINDKGIGDGGVNNNVDHDTRKDGGSKDDVDFEVDDGFYANLLC